MPQVKVDGKVKHLPYTPEGMATAKRLALRTGGKLKKRKKTVGTRPDTLLNTYKKTQDNVVKQKMQGNTAIIAGKDDPYGVREGGEYMKVPELPWERRKREREEYKAGAKKRADALRAKNPDAHHWKKKN